ncbi:ornithine carbamoyltransferase [soil metagenome]
MSFNLCNRSVLNLQDFEPGEINFLLELATELKLCKYAGNEVQRLKGKNIALIFEKPSTRTRCAFEVAVYDQGGHVTYIDSSSSQLGHKESLKDTARVLGRLYDGIEYRGFHQTMVEELAKYSHVPVWNGLTDEFHPTQILADLLTMKEFGKKPLHELSFCYLGDARFNMGNSLLIGGVQMGMDVRIAAPEAFWPSPELVSQMRQLAINTGAKITLESDPIQAVLDADFLYTDVWVSMGEPMQAWEERIKQLRAYQVNRELMQATGKPHTKFMHCLPAFHNLDTEVGREVHEKFGLKELEVTEEVFESEASIVFSQAENRMHTIKAILVATLN